MLKQIDKIDIKALIENRFPRFGINKQQEIIRLVYEIQKRESVDIVSIVNDAEKEAQNKTFSHIKKSLVIRRFPKAAENKGELNPYLPDISTDDSNKAIIQKELTIKPENIYIEESVVDEDLPKRLVKFFPEAHVQHISSLKNYMKEKKYTLMDYNQRRQNFFIVKEQYDFFKKCPCSPGATHCGYHVFNIGSGCPMECTYCYLQEYINTPGIILPANIKEYFLQFKNYPQKIHVGTGELSDSLALDHLTEYSIDIVQFFQEHPQSTFEFKTKSDNIGNLLKLRGVPNVVVSWSVSPEEIIKLTEFYTAPIERRLDAARRCAENGYRVAFHFDPVFLFDKWEKRYEVLIQHIFSLIPHDSISWMSIGTFRFSRELKKIIEKRFPDNNILSGELLPGFDGKMRYEANERKKVYETLLSYIRKHKPSMTTYLCMENKDLWKGSQSTRFDSKRS